MGRQQELFPEQPPEKWSLYQNAKLYEPPKPPPDASERERSLAAALAKAKQQIHELRARLVRADCVARTWVEVPHHPDTGTWRDAQIACGRMMVNVLSGESELSLSTALAEWRRATAGNEPSSTVDPKRTPAR
jgi:hypothetical protein